jgi:hypothetical protein
MTLAYPELTRTKEPERRLIAPAAVLRPPSRSIPVPPPKRRRLPTRAVVGMSTALVAVGLLAVQPWDELPRDKATLHEAFVNVGVPGPYRRLMDAPRQVHAPTHAPMMGQGAIIPQAAPAEAAPVAPSPVLAEAPPVLAAEPAPSAPALMLYALRPTEAAAPPQPVETAAPAKVEAKFETAASYRVQIAATATDVEAEDAWRDVRRAFPDESRERGLAVTPARVNGRDVRRAIVTGFPSAEAARAFCAQLSAAGRGCLLRGKG